MSFFVDIPRIVVAGTQSGVGKTTVVSGLLAVLRARGLCAQPYKVGPDYIDPGYHSIAAGRPCHNLDSWLMPEERMISMFARTSADADIAIIEGVMGLFDGGRGGIASTAEIAKRFDAPVVLVVNARSAGDSVAATVLGFLRYDSDVCIAGVIVNQLGSESHAQIVCEAIERIGVPVVGKLFRDEGLFVPERHLGLVPVTENETGPVMHRILDVISRGLDIGKILTLARQAKPLRLPDLQKHVPDSSVRIGIARDEAFSFYYPESMAVLEELGAELIEFSPLRDTELPNVDGLILGGGFPEMYLEQLSANKPMLRGIRQAAEAGMPLYAECGGYMVLTSSVTDFAGKAYPMAEIVPGKCRMEHKLQTVGYIEARAKEDNLLCLAGEALRGHEFHFSKMEMNPDFQPAFRLCKNRNGVEYDGGYAKRNVLGSYLHIHFAGNMSAARRFINICRQFSIGRQEREK